MTRGYFLFAHINLLSYATFSFFFFLFWSTSTYATALFNAAYHSLWMTYPNRCSRLTYLTLSHLHWSGRTLVLYSCCRRLNRCVAWWPIWSNDCKNPEWLLGDNLCRARISLVTYAQWNEVHGFLVSTSVALQIDVDHLHHGKCNKSASFLWHAWTHLVLIHL